MHPHTFYSTLFDYTKRDEVFVIMSFAPEFDERWCRVIEPAIREDLKLSANRVDDRVSGESIVLDILDGIAHARLVLAEITCSPMTNVDGVQWPQRNGNVMWELGIAHTMRLPDEVIVIRSDNERSIFDLTQFRAFEYDPRFPAQARKFIVELATDRLTTIDRSKSDYVRRSAEALDPFAFEALMRMPIDGTKTKIERNSASALSFPRLFDLNLVRNVNIEIGQVQHVLECELTELGKEVVKYLAKRQGYVIP